MKTIIGLSVFILLVSGRAFAIYQPINLGVANIAIATGTITDIQTSTAAAVGQLKWCTNCTANGGAGTLCISTGTTSVFQFVLSTGTACK